MKKTQLQTVANTRTSTPVIGDLVLQILATNHLCLISLALDLYV